MFKNYLDTSQHFKKRFKHVYQFTVSAVSNVFAVGSKGSSKNITGIEKKTWEKPEDTSSYLKKFLAERRKNFFIAQSQNYF